MKRVTAVSLAVLLVVGVGVSPWQGGLPAPGQEASWFGQLLLAVTFGFVGAAVAERAASPQDRVGLVLLVTGWCQAATFATSAYLLRPGDAPSAVNWLDGWLWAPGVLVAFCVLPLLFPAGSPPAGWRRLLGVDLGVIGVASTVAAYDALPHRSAAPAVVALAVALAVVTSLAGIAALAVRFRRGTAQERGQIRWLLWAVLLLVVVELVVPLLPGAAVHVVLSLAPLLVPLAVGVAVLRFELFDIDLLLTRTLVYLLATVGLLTAYVGVVAVLDRQIGGGALDRASFVALLAVALVAGPLQSRVQAWVGRRILGPSVEAGRAVANLTAGLAASPSVRESPRIVVDTLSAALHADVELVAGDRVVASTDVGGTWARVVEVHHSGRLVGLVRVGRRPAGALEPREERMLGELAAATGPVLDSLLLTEELRRERDRVSEVRDVERRRLRRDLHDGLGPTLAGLTMGLEAVRSMVRTSPDEAEVTVTRLVTLAGGATAEVRRVVDELRPAALEGRDLLEAIRAQVSLDGVTPEVVVRGSSLLTLPGPTEAAALRIVAEAVTNVRRHAGATRCEVHVSTDADSLVVLVDDDGCGLDGTTRGRGVGMTSMQQRVQTLGGELALVASPLGGTRVTARLPLVAPR